MRQDNGHSHEPLWRRMRAQYDRAVLNCCRVETMGGGRTLVQGCEEILEYGRERIILAVRDPDVRTVVVCGKDLSCLSYHPEAVVIEGCIERICFCCADREEQI